MGETITYLEGEFYEAALDGNAEAFNVYQERLLHCLVTPNQNTVLHVYLSENYFGPRYFQILCSYLMVQRSINCRSWDFVEQILNRCPSLLLKPNAKGEIPLHIAASSGHVNIVELLIERAKLEDGDLENGIELAKQMLRMMDNEENTALHNAIRYGHLDVVHALIQEDPDFAYSDNKSGETPLYIAARSGYDDLVTMILDKCKSANHDGPCGRTALHAAVMAKDEGSTKVILRRRKNLTKSVDENGQTPLHYAAHFGYSQIVKQLLKCDESATYITDNESMTALLMAARQGHYKIMTEIINHCPSCCEIVDRRGWSFCHFAILSLPLLTLCKFLRTFGGYRRGFLDKKDIHGNTPLQVLAASRVFTPIEGSPFNIVTVRKEDLDSKKKEQILKLVEEVRSGEVAGVAVHPLFLYGLRGLSGLDKVRASRSVVSALIATVTFTAMFTVPGGYKSDQSPEGQGTPILGHDSAFKAFMITNAIAMVSSLLAISFNHNSSFQSIYLRRRDAGVLSYSFMMIFGFVSEAAFVVAFITGINAVLKPSSALAISISCIFLSFLFGYFLLMYKIFISVF